MTRLPRNHDSDEFNSNRAANTAYEDTQFFALQTLTRMFVVNTAVPSLFVEGRQPTREQWVALYLAPSLSSPAHSRQRHVQP